MPPIVAPVHHPMCRRPVAAAVQRPCIPSEPVVSHPPAIRVISRRAVAVAVVVALIRVARVAVSKVAVAETTLRDPPGLRHDAAEPATPPAVHGAVQVGSFGPLGCACGGQWCRAFATRQEDRLCRRVAVIVGVGVVLRVVAPVRAGVIRAVLRWALGTCAPPRVVACWRRW